MRVAHLPCFAGIFGLWRGMDLNHQPRAYEHPTVPKNPLAAFSAGYNQQTRLHTGRRPPDPFVVWPRDQTMISVYLSLSLLWGQTIASIQLFRP